MIQEEVTPLLHSKMLVAIVVVLNINDLEFHRIYEGRSQTSYSCCLNEQL